MSFPIQHSFTLFLYAFRVPENTLAQFNKQSIWQQSQLMPDDSFLFSHVQAFFTRNHNRALEHVDPNEALLFELKQGKLSGEEKEAMYLFRNLFRRTHQMGNDDDLIEFSLYHDASILSPKIFYVPLTSVGILSYGMSLATPYQNTTDLIKANYRLRIYAAGQVEKIATPRNMHPKAHTSEQILSDTITKEFDIAQPERAHLWNIRSLVSYLLNQFNPTIHERLSPNRLQAFSYVQTKEELPPSDLEEVLFRLRRIYNEKYHPSDWFLSHSNEVAQTFREVHYGASVEGAIIFVNVGKEAQGTFLSNYDNVVRQRMIWVYLLAYHQRVALIMAASDTTELFKGGIDPTTDALSQLVERLSRIQLKCLFQEVSHYTQQNDFYYLCRDNLRIPQLFEEVKAEVLELNQIIGEKRQQEELARRDAEEAQLKRRAGKLEMLLAVLILPQIWIALLSTNYQPFDRWFNQMDWFVETFSSLILLFVMFIIIRLYIFRRYASRRKK